MKNYICLKSEILRVLPNTQCKRCGFETCEEFASALLDKRGSINDCPPGGEEVRRDLAGILDEELDPASLIHEKETFMVAFITDNDCIGCTKCLPVCPMDSIIGAKTKTHTVVTEWCTGCRLCAPACPTDCIDFIPASGGELKISREISASRFSKKRERLEKIEKSQETSASFIDVDDSYKEMFLDSLISKVE